MDASITRRGQPCWYKMVRIEPFLIKAHVRGTDEFGDV
jgi:hypothetical protein